MGGLQSRSMSLQDVQDFLKEKGIEIEAGELRAILSGLFYLGLVERRKTHKNSYKYKIKNPEIQ